MDGNLKLKEVLEVEKMDEQIGTLKFSNNFLERLSDQAKNRHVDVMKKFEIELETLGLEMKRNMLSASYTLHENLNQSRKKIANLSSSLNKTKEDHKEKELLHIWHDCCEEYTLLRSFIQDFYLSMIKQEYGRVLMVCDFLKHLYQELVTIGYASVNDVKRDVHEIAFKLDQTSVNNKRIFSELNLQLKLSSIQEQQQHYFQWLKLWNYWHQQVEASVQQHLRFLIKTEWQNNEVKLANDFVRKFVVSNDHLNLQRIRILYAVSNIKPPDCSTECVIEWFNNVQKLNVEHNELIRSLEIYIQHDKEKLNIYCRNLLETIKCSLIARDINLKPSSVDRIAASEMPHLEEHFMINMNSAEIVKLQAEIQRDGVTALGDAVYELLLTVVETWERHETCMTDAMYWIRCQLDTERSKMLSLCMEKEHELTNILGKMEKETVINKLNEGFELANAKLQNIKEIYNSSNRNSLNILKSYSSKINDLLKKYCLQLKLRFQDSAAGLLVSFPVEKSYFGDSSPTDDHIHQMVDSAGLLPVDLNLLNVTPHFGGFYSDPQFYTQSTQNDKAHVALLHSKSILMASCERRTWQDTESRLQQIQRILFTNFAIHWEKWEHLAMSAASSIITTKSTEINNEYTFRQDMHESRMKRVEIVIYQKTLENIRKHETKISNHTSYITNQLKFMEKQVTNYETELDLSLEELKLAIAQKLEQIKFISTSTRMKTCKESWLNLIQDFNGSKIVKNEGFKAKISEHLSSLKHIQNGVEDAMKQFVTIESSSTIKMREELCSASSLISKMEETITVRLQELEARIRNDISVLNKEVENKLDCATEEYNFIEQIRRLFLKVQLKVKNEVLATNLSDSNLNEKMKELENRTYQLKHFECNKFEDLVSILNELQSLSKDIFAQGHLLGVLNEVGMVKCNSLATKGIIGSGDIPESKAVNPVKSNAEKTVVTRSFHHITDVNFADRLNVASILRETIKLLLSDCLREITSIFEKFYLQKVPRTNYFPDMITNLEDGKKMVLTKLQSFWQQAEDYFIQIVTEYINKLNKFKAITRDVAYWLPENHVQQHNKKLADYMSEFSKEWDEFNFYWENILKQLKGSMKLYLGRPSATLKLHEFVEEAKHIISAKTLEFRLTAEEMKKQLRSAEESFTFEAENLLIITLEELSTMLSESDIKNDVVAVVYGLSHTKSSSQQPSDAQSSSISLAAKTEDSKAESVLISSHKRAKDNYKNQFDNDFKTVVEQETHVLTEIKSWQEKWDHSIEKLQTLQNDKKIISD